MIGRNNVIITPEYIVAMSAEDRDVDLLKPLVTPPRPPGDDAAPAFLNSKILLGAARHAFAIADLRKRGVTAVLNLAPRACADCSTSYEAEGIGYLELDAEDIHGYALFETHLDRAVAFLEKACAATEAKVLVHCFAGVNRSASIAVAFIMLSERKALEDVVEAAFAARPFILTNETFRRDLVALARARGLLREQRAAAGANTTGAAETLGGNGCADGCAQSYELREALGEGAFATVYRCVLPALRDNGVERVVAAKVVRRQAKWVWIGGKSVRSERAYETIVNERDALERVGAHPRVVRGHGWLVEDARAILLLELVPGGDLETILSARPDGLSEEACHSYASDLFAALAHCHGRGVIHRDVKLPNLLLAADGTVRLADFGGAAIVDAPADGATPPQVRLHDKLGTRSYVAPEIIACDAEGYLGPPSDMWSAGICCFTMLSARLPFAIADEIADWRFAKVAAAQAEGRSSCQEIASWTTTTDGGVPWGEPAASLIDALLAVEPRDRPTAVESMRTGWLSFATVSRPRPGARSPAPALHAAASCTASAATARPPSAALVEGQAHAGRLTRQRSREASFDLRPPPAAAAPPVPQARDPLGRSVAPAECTYRLRERTPGASRKRAFREAQEERTVMWRGVETATRTEMQSSASFPSSSLRYTNLRHNDTRRSFHWLREDRGRLPLVEVDRPFKVARDNNNNYLWASSGPSSLSLSDRWPHASAAAHHPSRRSCPWAR